METCTVLYYVPGDYIDLVSMYFIFTIRTKGINVDFTRAIWRFHNDLLMSYLKKQG